MQGEYEEDPLAEHKREFLRKQQLKRQQEEHENHESIQRGYNWLRYGLIPVIAILVFLIMDFLLPYKTFHETANNSWQKVTYRRYDHRIEYVHTYMQTQHFEFEVPERLHVNYDYHNNPQVIDLQTTYLLSRPAEAGVVIDGEYNMFRLRAQGKPENFHFPIFILTLSLVCLVSKSYSVAKLTLVILTYMFAGLQCLIYIGVIHLF